MVIKYLIKRPLVQVTHLPTREVYTAELLDDRDDGTFIFKIIGDTAWRAQVFIESDNLEVDTLFETGVGPR